MKYKSKFLDVEFSHAFQPILDVNKQKIISYEVLLRGTQQEPPSFVFDKVGTKNSALFDQYSREEAIKKASNMGASCSLNLNFSPDSIIYKNGQNIQKTLDVALEYGFSQEDIIVEITEGEIIRNFDKFTKVLENLRRQNILIAIDDFGSGFAGLNTLFHVMPDLIKIDKDLIRDVHKCGAKQAIIKATISVCFDLGIDYLAEGVETLEEYQFLQSIGIELYQGYLFARPGFECLPQIVDDKKKFYAICT